MTASGGSSASNAMSARAKSPAPRRGRAEGASEDPDPPEWQRTVETEIREAGTDQPCTLGVAIAIPEPHASVLTAWRRRVGDPQADLIWPHVTLLPPTPVEPIRMGLIEEHLAAAAASRPPFVMHLSGSGTFRPVSPVVFIQVARGLSDCELLEKVIRRGPLQRPLDFPYHPHVTVAQDVPGEALDFAYDGLSGFLARFTVERFTLFERHPDGKWLPRSEFALGA
jgi:2'-5' RNA ligase